MDSLNAHKKFIYAMGIKNPALTDHYKMWMKEYPENVTIPLSIGTVFYNALMSETRDFLLGAAAIDPGNGNTWLMLSNDAFIRGEYDLSAEYIGKAIQADPSNPGYAFTYLRSFKNGDQDTFRKEVFNFIKRFPEDNLGATALYQLGESAIGHNDKIRYYEELRQLYPPQKFGSSASGMIELADIYLQKDPEKALVLIREMGEGSEWKAREKIAELLVEIGKPEQARKYTDIISKLDGVQLPGINYIDNFIALKKASLREKNGDVKSAYDSLTVKFAKLPADELYNALETYGKKTGKGREQVRKDIDAIRTGAATPAYPFELGLYTSDEKLSLTDLRGKVTLLTFWFPGCSPCKDEFPHFQAVVDSFKEDSLAYIGINVLPLEDGHVLPFIENNKFSFIPLRGSLSFAGEKYGVGGFPGNFLIDKEGKIIFSDFRIDHSNHRTLELMISSLLEKEPRQQ